MTLSLSVDTIPLHSDADGVVRVGTTRVTLDTVVSAFVDGATPEEIAQQYPVLRLADVYQVIAYYLYHQPEVEAYLQQRYAQADVVRRETESRLDPSGVRERLVARRQG
ncbi:MAG: DUF433 domain-containing protein [Anaerolineae bacterium]